MRHLSIFAALAAGCLLAAPVAADTGCRAADGWVHAAGGRSERTELASGGERLRHLVRIGRECLLEHGIATVDALLVDVVRPAGDDGGGACAAAISGREATVLYGVAWRGEEPSLSLMRRAAVTIGGGDRQRPVDLRHPLTAGPFVDVVLGVELELEPGTCPDADDDPGWLIRAGGVAAQPGVEPAGGYTQPPPRKPRMIFGDVKPPRKVSAPPPEYTEEARLARIQGVVIVQTVIDAEGNVESAKVLRGLGNGLSGQAVEAIRSWKFEPATLHGVPIPVYYNVTVNFRLE